MRQSEKKTLLSKSTTKKLKYLIVVVLTIVLSSPVACAQIPGNADDTNWLIEVLELKEGSVVADIGAGDGDETIEIAKHVGPNGHVYSTELGSEKIQNLRSAINGTELNNVTVIEGEPAQTNLPEQCCDALYMRRVYHHFGNPASMNKSLWKSLKPGGRIAIIDFEPRGSEAEPSGRDSNDQHGVTAETVVDELEHAGFQLINSENKSGRDIYVVMEKPEMIAE
ncbi:methyltransferase domain-containing protein [Aliifodinibius salicampi]|uniref:Methyltransferase domain-containing protein n=1 Tax=Fodinibius salicampi TaxID=1920655 RepID=A0ABT3PUR1_9BACT|nr:methyltransferase domain-containing protein [Fodinibius salicampi]MCW9711597.1 methyltransferase domain-containing protein [Fodinibius salicampi]